MPLNLGVIALGGAGVAVRIYYDTVWLDADPTRNPDGAPLVNGPRGYCLDVTNTSGANRRVTVAGLAGNPITATVGQGDPVTTGNARSRTAAQLAALGLTTRGNVGTVSLE
jgi:hypothetical protein